jgi:hypothetical protein
MNQRETNLQGATRRHFLRDCSVGLGGMALSTVLGRAGFAQESDNPLSPRHGHFRARAKNVIYLHMAGSPPHLDLLDYKPELVKHDGQDCPDAFLKGKRFAFTSGVPKLLGSPGSGRSAARTGPGSPTRFRTCRRSPTSSASSGR